MDMNQRQADGIGTGRSSRKMGRWEREEEEDPIFMALSNQAMVDGHCHNVVENSPAMRYERAFSEAEGHALDDAHHTLSFKRSVREIGSLLGCDGDFDSIKKRRETLGQEAVARVCFDSARISALLIDDGLRSGAARSLGWHTSYVPLVKRVLRVEAVSEDILSEMALEDKATWTLDSFEAKLRAALDPLPESVVAFKSIAAYRSGLDIEPNVKREDAEAALGNLLGQQGDVRIVDKHLVDLIFVLALEVATKLKIPMQIHTGFGDKDLDLRLANPGHLRRVLEDKRFEKSRIVLLHASYPYMREAGYLASVYPQVYLDFGLAIPKLSVHGMFAALKGLLELAPLNKVMASTDAYIFPEIFYLGALWTRRILSCVLRESVNDGDLTEIEAIAAGKAVLSGNSVRLYGLDQAIIDSCEHSDGETVCNQQSTVKRPTCIPNQNEFVRVTWMDVSGLRRCKAVPKQRYETIASGEGLSNPKILIALSNPFDAPPPGCPYGPDNEVRLLPEEDTRRSIPWCSGHDIVLTTLYKAPGEVWESCPRGNLVRMLAQLKKEFNLELRAGFENEFYLLKPATGTETELKWMAIEQSTYGSAGGLDVAAPLLSQIGRALGEMGITVDLMHSESGPGQYEIVQRYSEAVSAADNVILIREAITSLARKEGLRATFIPKYFVDACGSGNHVHCSIWESGENVFGGSSDDPSAKWGISKRGQQFVAGIVHHLPALMAVTAPNPNSVFSRILALQENKAEAALIRAVEEAEGKIALFPPRSLEVHWWSIERAHRLQSWDELQVAKSERWKEILSVKGIQSGDRLTKSTFQRLLPQFQQKEMKLLQHPFDKSAPEACTSKEMCLYAELYFHDILTSRRSNTECLYAELYFHDILTSRRSNTELDMGQVHLTDLWELVEARLPQEGRLDLDRPITDSEAKQAIKAMARGKAPGSDGMTVELSHMFWPELGGVLFEMYNNALIGAWLPSSMSHGVITLFVQDGGEG
ncbi:hypothetical protein CBR_g37575 [Chara braunii]|uniref:GS catalytic domain-containing protein n=1 Tax=Chara braunii TaxID=69332 RepID=A0A388LNA5_CHABU|nr:hypothetical protein CBR_g37575 [Chara braunii]|eukprot:GBG83774.1 hypothetical protein CBR_g37575 [Chara braunii]